MCRAPFRTEGYASQRTLGQPHTITTLASCRAPLLPAVLTAAVLLGPALAGPALAQGSAFTTCDYRYGGLRDQHRRQDCRCALSQQPISNPVRSPWLPSGVAGEPGPLGLGGGGLCLRPPPPTPWTSRCRSARGHLASRAVRRADPLEAGSPGAAGRSAAVAAAGQRLAAASGTASVGADRKPRPPHPPSLSQNLVSCHRREVLIVQPASSTGCAFQAQSGAGCSSGCLRSWWGLWLLNIPWCLWSLNTSWSLWLLRSLWRLWLLHT